MSWYEFLCTILCSLSVDLGQALESPDSLSARIDSALNARKCPRLDKHFDMEIQASHWLPCYFPRLANCDSALVLLFFGAEKTLLERKQRLLILIDLSSAITSLLSDQRSSLFRFSTFSRPFPLVSGKPFAQSLAEKQPTCSATVLLKFSDQSLECTV